MSPSGLCSESCGTSASVFGARIADPPHPPVKGGCGGIFLDWGCETAPLPRGEDGHAEQYLLPYGAREMQSRSLSPAVGRASDQGRRQVVCYQLAFKLGCRRVGRTSPTATRPATSKARVPGSGTFAL